MNAARQISSRHAKTSCSGAFCRANNWWYALSSRRIFSLIARALGIPCSEASARYQHRKCGAQCCGNESARALSCVMNMSQIMKRVSLSECVKWKEQGNMYSPRRAAEEPGPDFQGWELRTTSYAAECLPRGVVFRSLQYKKISF